MREIDPIDDLLREFDPARRADIPGPDSADAQTIRRRVYKEATGSPRHRSRRLLIAIAAGLLLTAGTAAAVTISRNLSSVLESEGRGLEEGSDQNLRHIEIGGATWTMVRYSTTDGDECVDFELRTGTVYHGSIGGCGFGTLETPIEGDAGGVWDGRDFRVLLTGRSAPDVARVSASDNLGHVLTDQPVGGIWVIVPAPEASSWMVDAFNNRGERIGRIEIVFES